MELQVQDGKVELRGNGGTYLCDAERYERWIVAGRDAILTRLGQFWGDEVGGDEVMGRYVTFPTWALAAIVGDCWDTSDLY